MARRWWKRLLLAFGVLFLLAWGYDYFCMIYWVGNTDLEIEFAVTDGINGSSISGARVEVHSAGGFYEENYKQEFVLVADDDGVARRECRQCMCCGEQSGLRFTDTFAVYVPCWRFRVVADGYEPGEWIDLNIVEYARRARRTGPGTSKLVVPVLLRKR